MVYASTRDLPRIGFAVMQAEGFVNLALPRVLRRTSRAPRPCAHGVAERGVRTPSRA
jgi:lysyl-tRNA synthetase class 2